MFGVKYNMVDMETMPRSIGADYSVWTPDTEILLTNVPWDNNYRDVVKFANSNARNAYIESLTSVSTRIESSRYARADQPLNLSIPMTEAYGFNYVRVYNPRQAPVNNAPMYYYYFILGVEYVNPGVTRFLLQVDVWNTFSDAVTFGSCYVDQGHIGVANKNSYNNYNREYLTLEEGLDAGSNMNVVQSVGVPLIGPDNAAFYIVYSVDIHGNLGNASSPVVKTATGVDVQGAPQGAGIVYFRTRAACLQFISDMSAYPWVSQGFMSIGVLPNIFLPVYGFVPQRDTKITASTAEAYFIVGSVGSGTTGAMVPAGQKWRNAAAIRNHLGTRYQNLRKFLSYPYTVIEMTAFNGSPVVLRPEDWFNDEGRYKILVAIVPGSQRVVIVPRDYNATAVEGTVNDNNVKQDEGDYLNMGLVISNLPTFAILNNAGILAVSQQAHTIAQSYRTNDWSQSKALQGNSVSYDQSSAAIGNTNNQAAIGRGANTSTAQVANSQAIARGFVNGAQGAISGGIAGIEGGGVGAGVGAVAGIAAGAAGVALDVSQRNQNLNISNSASVASTLSTTQTAAYMRDTNKGLADWSARGDYAMGIASISAKIQDMELTPPTTAGQAGGDTLNYSFNGINVQFRVKMIDQAHIRSIGEYWLRYGYKVQSFTTPPPSLMVMTKFTYWKMLETYIVAGRIPEAFKQSIRGIFEKGVTVWARPQDIGVIDRADNQPLAGVTL